jgi:hypothetical protein
MSSLPRCRSLTVIEDKTMLLIGSIIFGFLGAACFCRHICMGPGIAQTSVKQQIASFGE